MFFMNETLIQLLFKSLYLPLTVLVEASYLKRRVYKLFTLVIYHPPHLGHENMLRKKTIASTMSQAGQKNSISIINSGRNLHKLEGHPFLFIENNTNSVY
jgi:hypothetical protein